MLPSLPGLQVDGLAAVGVEVGVGHAHVARDGPEERKAPSCELLLVVAIGVPADGVDVRHRRLRLAAGCALLAGPKDRPAGLFGVTHRNCSATTQQN